MFPQNRRSTKDSKEYKKITAVSICAHFKSKQKKISRQLPPIDLWSAYVTPASNNELQCNVGNMWEKNYLYLHALKAVWRKHFKRLLHK
jgi:hypothetical protein